MNEISVLNDKNDVKLVPQDPYLFLKENVALALDGSPIAAAIAAILIHMKYDVNNEFTCMYDQFLYMVLESKDSELIVCVGEEIFEGKILAVNAELAYKFFLKDDELSGFMWAYVAARILRTINPKKSRELLQRSIKSGHIPSLMLKQILDCERIPVIGFFMRAIYYSIGGIRVMKALNGADPVRRLWRYRDFAASPISEIDEVIGCDRRRPFEGLKALAKQSARAS